MLPRLVSLAIAMCGIAVGCGEEDSVSDGDIVQALELERSDGGYTIGGEPFCEVSGELLNDSSEVEDATGGNDKLELVITDSGETVGVQGVPPFDPECERDARRALNRLAED
jgi:hypothetical protein